MGEDRAYRITEKDLVGLIYEYRLHNADLRCTYDDYGTMASGMAKVGRLLLDFQARSSGAAIEAAKPPGSVEGAE